MAKHVIHIDGPIAGYYISKNYIKNELAKAGSNDVEVRISSLGGSVDHALAIHEMLVAHKGKVTAVLSGFVASSATIISMGAEDIQMSENAFFLVHKVMTWVDEWGLMNEDDLDKVIENLSKEKEENKKMDLVIARMYARKTGKSIEDVHQLMQKDTWLDAEETKTWGFIDSVYKVDPSNKKNLLEDTRRVAQIAAAGLPTPKRKENAPQSDQQLSHDQAFAIAEQTVDNILQKMAKKFFPGKNNSTINTNSKTSNMDPKKFAALFAVLGLTAMESDDDGANLTMEQFEAVEKELGQLAQARTDLKAAQDLNNQVLTALNDIDPTVKDAEGHEAKIQAVLAYVAKQPITPTGNEGGDPKENDGKEDWETIDNLPHNKEADDMIM